MAYEKVYILVGDNTEGESPTVVTRFFSLDEARRYLVSWKKALILEVQVSALRSYEMSSGLTGVKIIDP